MGKRVGKTSRRDRKLLYYHWDDVSPAGESWKTVCFRVTPLKGRDLGHLHTSSHQSLVECCWESQEGRGVGSSPSNTGQLYSQGEWFLCRGGCRGSSRHRGKGTGSCKFSGSILKDRGQRIGWVLTVSVTPSKHVLEIPKTSGSESLRNLRDWFSLSLQGLWDFSTEHPVPRTSFITISLKD